MLDISPFDIFIKNIVAKSALLLMESNDVMHDHVGSGNNLKEIDSLILVDETDYLLFRKSFRTRISCLRIVLYQFLLMDKRE